MGGAGGGGCDSSRKGPRLPSSPLPKHTQEKSLKSRSLRSPEMAFPFLIISCNCPARLQICILKDLSSDVQKRTKLSVINTPVPSIQH